MLGAFYRPGRASSGPVRAVAAGPEGPAASACTSSPAAPPCVHCHSAGHPPWQASPPWPDIRSQPTRGADHVVVAGGCASGGDGRHRSRLGRDAPDLRRPLRLVAVPPTCRVPRPPALGRAGRAAGPSLRCRAAHRPVACRRHRAAAAAAPDRRGARRSRGRFRRPGVHPHGMPELHPGEPDQSRRGLLPRRSARSWRARCETHGGAGAGAPSGALARDARHGAGCGDDAADAGAALVPRRLTARPRTGHRVDQLDDAHRIRSSASFADEVVNR